ncbi:GNAT family N-acetyltransferase [Cytobacillus eiseniae]|uniref:GNAT family N-acetyltransferase n=1 Tax=Cytobacillus eiseniae TaxID=762947 RepID=UPI000A0171EC|nr:GNAT family N-acetyltransferase [Cytobacillus eiseniae]
MKFRKATIDDCNQLVNLRKLQLIDEGIEPSINIDAELSMFFKNKLGDGTIIQWLVEDHKDIIACGAIIFYEFPPSYTNRTGKRAYIANMYTKDHYRGQGIATKLLSTLVNEVKQLGITKIWLTASKMGKPVYKKFGFIEVDDDLELSIND